MKSALKNVFLGCFCLLLAFHAYAVDVEKLSEAEIKMTKQVIAKLEPLIQQRDAAGDLAKLTFKELYEPLNKEERAFLDSFRKLKGKKVGSKLPYHGIATGKEDLVRIKGQKVKEKIRVKNPDGSRKTVLVDRTIPPQFLPRDVHAKYLRMMTAMETDIDKKLFIESGYRSSAYQLYIFIYYLKNHGYSILETAKFVALPGYSEHGNPKHQAIDFINKDGVNGDPNTDEFEALPENHWLLDHAHEFGFVLSYPKTGAKGVTYEPWHWRYDPKAAGKVRRSES